MVINGLHILGVLMGSQDFATHFLDEVLFKDMVHIDDFPFLVNIQVALGILSSCVIRRPSYLTRTMLFFFPFMSLSTSFDKRVM